VQRLFQMVPAYIVDTVMRLTGRKPFLVNIYEKTVRSINVRHKT
jgi:hypothetical protein